MSLYLMFVVIAIAAIVVVCIGLIGLGAFGTLWLIGHGHVEVKVGKQAQEDADEGAQTAALDRSLARPDAFGEGEQSRIDEGARRIRLHQP